MFFYSVSFLKCFGFVITGLTAQISEMEEQEGEICFNLIKIQRRESILSVGFQQQDPELNIKNPKQAQFAQKIWVTSG